MTSQLLSFPRDFLCRKIWPFFLTRFGLGFAFSACLCLLALFSEMLLAFVLSGSHRDPDRRAAGGPLSLIQGTSASQGLQLPFETCPGNWALLALIKIQRVIPGLRHSLPACLDKPLKEQRQLNRVCSSTNCAKIFLGVLKCSLSRFTVTLQTWSCSSWV